MDSPETRSGRRWLVKLLRRTGWFLLGTFVFFVGLWCALALYYSNLPRALRPWAAGLFVVAAVAALFFVKSRLRSWLTFTTLVVAVIVYWILIPPSSDRHWRADVAVLPKATVQGNLLTIHNVRNFNYTSTTNFETNYYDRTYDLDKLRCVDFYMSFWAQIPFCHTMVSFGFEGGDYLCVSIETRPEEGEGYSPLAACFKQYELIYVAGDERDLIRLRTNFRDESVYLYRIQTTPEGMRRFLLRYCDRINDLAAHPEWYYTLTRNCTTDIPRRNGDAYGLFPESWKIVINGFVNEFLFREGSLDQSHPLAELKRLGHINTRGQLADKDPEFSARIREGIPAGRGRWADVSGQMSAGRCRRAEVSGQMSDLRPPTSDRRPPTADLRPPTADLRPPTADRRPPTADRRPPTADRRPPTAGRRLPRRGWVGSALPFGCFPLASWLFTPFAADLPRAESG